MPLEGIKIVDLSRVLAGPYCTMMLGDMGAEVVKVEAPGGSDETRQWGPPWAGGESAYYLCVNRNKKAITLNLKAPEGKEVLFRLVRDADVLIENFRVGIMEGLGLGYDRLSEINPGLVYCSISGFGTDGPYKDVPGYDFVVQAMGGLMSFTGEPDGEPMKVGVAVVDITAGMLAATGILAALRARDKTGKGQRVDISLLESMVAWLSNVGSNYLISGQVPKRYGNQHPNIVPYQTFRARDGYFVVAVGNDRQYRRFCRILERPDLAEDPKYATNPERLRHRSELIPLLQEILAEREVDYWISRMMEAEIPCAPINNVAQVFSHPQVLQRQMLVEVLHPAAGIVKMAGIPIKLSGTPGKIRTHPPLVGEHTEEVLGAVGYGPDEIRALREKGAI